MEVSKKLTLDVDGNLIVDDGSEAKEEKEKEAEKHMKEVQKDLDSRAKDAEAINDAEAETPKFVDGSGKKLNIKKLSEKLTLSEEDIEEAIPYDVAKAYRRADFAPDKDADLQKAEYKEISPEEAYRVIKDGSPKDLRLLVNGKLVTLNDYGYGSKEHRVSVGYYSDKVYMKKNGDLIDDTKYMPIKHLLSIADKIYLTDEKVAKKDPDLMASRAENPESPNYKNLLSPGGSVRATNGWASRIDNKSSVKNLERNHKRIDNNLRTLKSMYDNGEISKDEYDNKRRLYLKDLERYQRSKGEFRDQAARLRNLDSENALIAGIKEFKTLKSSVVSAERQMKDALNELTSIKTDGSKETRRMRSDYKELLNRLYEIQKQIDLYEFRLEDADELDSEAINSAQTVYDDLEKSYNEILSKKNALLNRKRG